MRWGNLELDAKMRAVQFGRFIRNEHISRCGQGDDIRTSFAMKRAGLAY